MLTPKELPIKFPASVTRIEVMNDFFVKYHLDNGQVVHHFKQADTGYPHDHPWPFESTILLGGYQEEEYTLHPNGTYTTTYHDRLLGQSHSVKASTVHRITHLFEGECWTLVSPGKGERVPGFYRFEYDTILRRDWNESEWTLLYPNYDLNN